MAVTPDDVRRMAALARIGVPGDRVESLVRELGGILAHMDVLSKVTEAVAAAPRAGMPLAADEPPPVPLDRPCADFAPEMRAEFFLVPRLATHEDGARSP